MADRHAEHLAEAVAPFTGAWIEIRIVGCGKCHFWSLPSRERGLKSVRTGRRADYAHVAPFTGAWIEILTC